MKLYCCEILNKDHLAIFGGESDKKPFISVHNMLDTGFSLHGFNKETFAKMEARLKDKSHYESEAEYLMEQEGYQMLKNNDQIGFLSFPTLNRCIYNVRLFRQQKHSKLIACTDFSSTLLLLELDDRGPLTIVAQTQLHTDLIQGLLVHENSIYTCSADKTVSRVQVKLKAHGEDEHGYGLHGRKGVPKSVSLLPTH